MPATAQQLWNTWRDSQEMRDLAEGWITSPTGQLSDEHEKLDELFGFSPSKENADPDRALATIFAIMQLTDDPELLASLGAGPLEDFLGLHGEAYLDIIHELALQEPRLREVLDNVWQGRMPKRVWHRIEILQKRAFS